MTRYVAELARRRAQRRLAAIEHRIEHADPVLRDLLHDERERWARYAMNLRRLERWADAR